MLRQSVPLNMDATSNYISNKAFLFLEAWKRSVQLIGIKYFGDGTEQGFQNAQCIWDLRPNIPLINQKIASLDIEERKFLIFFVSMYDEHAAGNLLLECSLSLEDITVNLIDKYQDAVQDLFNNWTDAGWW